MTHDRIHAKRPHDAERFRVGSVVTVEERDGHCVVTVEPDDASDGDDRIELVVTMAVRDLFVSRLDVDSDESPVGQRVWFREYGGR